MEGNRLSQGRDDEEEVATTGNERQRGKYMTRIRNRIGERKESLGLPKLLAFIVQYFTIAFYKYPWWRTLRVT